MMLKGKVALVTGGSRGIGRAIVKAYAMNGADVYVNARREGSVDRLCGRLSDAHQVNVTPVYFDVEDERGMQGCFERIERECGKLDILVNNAAIAKDALLNEIDRDSVQRLFSVNVFAVIALMKGAVRLMRKAKCGGSIVNLSSVVGQNGSPGQIVYSATKGAVTTITRSAAKELAPERIRVNAIAPGLVDTEMMRALGDEKLEKLVKRVLGFGRMATPGEVADTAVYLASDLSEYVTGQIIAVDGSMVM